MKTRKLTEKQKVFVAEYHVDLNGTQAAIRAGYSPKTAEVIANQLLKKTWVSEAIKKQMEERLHRVGVTSERVLTKMAHLAFADLPKIYGPENTLLPVKDFPDEIVPAIASIKTTELFEGRGADRRLVGYTKEVRLWDPNPALTIMAKHLGLIGNRKHREKEEDEEAELGKALTPLGLSPKIVYYVKLAVDNVKKMEAQKALSGKSLDEKPT